MSQMTVKWCRKKDLHDGPFKFAGPDYDEVAVVPLSALRDFLNNVRTHLLVGYTEDMEEVIEIDRLLASLGEGKMIDMTRFESAPCYLCGYNGAGYYNTDKHPCAAKYHDARHQAEA